MKKIPFLTTVGFLLLNMWSLASAQFIWIEGESSKQHTMQRHPWYNSVNKDSLSGNEWLSHFQAGRSPEALYPFQVKIAGEYHFWIRANSVAGPKLSYRLDNKPWGEVNFSNAIENLNIATDGKPDMRFISWNNAGTLQLTQGNHTIRFKFHSANNNHGGLDCFVFTRKPFVPRGTLKPGEKTGKANPGYFAWEPESDEFRPDALIDLRYLNEAVAGQEGYIQARGNDFVLANGRKVKFWAVNAGPGIWMLDEQSHIYLAKHLAKHGVNMIRLHGGIYGSNDPKVNMDRLKKLQHMVWAMKQEGIYTKISFYFPAWFRLDSWHKQGNRWPFMLLFFDEDMQNVYFNWADKLLTTVNPYTGVALARDPAVAMLEIQNEDSHFFYTFNKKNAPPERWERLKTIYGQWLKKKYGTIDNAIRAWGGSRVEEDDPRAGKMELFNAWFMTTDGLKSNPANRKRISDQVRFLTANMREFYQEAIEYFRRDGGYQGLVSCGNWHTADARTLDALERYCYTAGDVIDRHGYFDHNHKGESASYSIRPGHTFQSQSALTLQHNNPLPYVETEGFPSIITEIGWPMPNMYRAESVFLAATYGSMLGMDGIFHFAVGSSSWDQSVKKFLLNNPTALGSYYAAALVYRKGYVREAPAVVTENIRVDDLYDLQGSAAYVRPAFDQFRAAQIPDGTIQTGPLEKAIDPMAFYVGRVVRNFNGRPEQSKTMNLSKQINRSAKTMTSITNELHWDYGVGVVTMNTPKAQGAAGFLGRKGPIQLEVVTIDMKNDYGTVMAVALDNKPIVDSEKILIQCMTIDQLYGWETSEAGGLNGTIRNTGSAPWGVEKYKASVALQWKGSKPIAVIACDENGYQTNKPVKHRRSADKLTVEIDASTAYTVIRR
jgi:hypothetical protein